MVLRMKSEVRDAGGELERRRGCFPPESPPTLASCHLLCRLFLCSILSIRTTAGTITVTVPVFVLEISNAMAQTLNYRNP